MTLKSHTDKISGTGRFCATFLTGSEIPQHLGAAGSGLFCSQVVWGGELGAAEREGLSWEGWWFSGIPYLEDTCPPWNPSRLLCLVLSAGPGKPGFHEGVTFPID